MLTSIDSSISRRALRPAILWSLVVLNTAGILLVGLSARGFGFDNDVEWSSSGSGIEFGEHGLAYTDPFATRRDPARPAGPGFTLEVALRPDESAERGFQFIAVVHSGEDDSQFLIAQWRQTIIVMNGDDYDHRRRLPRLSTTISDLGADPFFLAVRSDARGSALYVDGRRVALREDVTFRLPTDDTPGRLVLGNSVYGDSSWSGRILGVALHVAALDEPTIQGHLELWRDNRGFTGSEYESAHLSYPLSELTGREALDQSSRGNDLHFPREQSFVTPKLFADDINPFAATRLMTFDVVINVVGFIPLGFLLFALVTRVTSVSRRSALATTIVTGFVLSLGIEAAQAWIPSRSSSVLDLLLNTMGTGLGSVAFLVGAARVPARDA